MVQGTQARLTADADAGDEGELPCRAMASRKRSNRRPTRSGRASSDQPELPLTTRPKQRGPVEPEQAAKIAVARRAKPSPVPDHVRLVLTLEIRRALAEQLSLQAIREGKNIEAILIEVLEAAAKRWR